MKKTNTKNNLSFPRLLRNAQKGEAQPNETLGISSKKLVIDMQGINKEFPIYKDVQKVLFDINIKIKPGEFVAIMGPSGSGKSTLMNIIGALDTATSGIYKLYGLPIEDMAADDLATARNEYIGFVFQSFNLLTKRSVLDNVMLPLMYRGISAEERLAKSREMLQVVGLDKFENYLPNQLSGGMRQRVAIARALAGNPKLILADEPTGALDSKMGNEILKFFQKLNRDTGITIVMITHEFFIAKYASRLIHIRDGRITFDGPVPKTEDKIK